MLIKDIKDFCNQEYKFINFVDLLEQHIYYIDATLQIFKFKIDNMNVAKVDNKVFVEFNCTPLAAYGLSTYYDDILINYEDVNKLWFLNFAAAKKELLKLKAKRIITLF